MFGKESYCADYPPIPYRETTEESRKLLVENLAANIYGKTPPDPLTVRAIETYRHTTCFDGVGEHLHFRITVATPNGYFAFPFTLSRPKTDRKVPLMVNISFDKGTPSGFAPEEELVRKGIAIA